MSGSDILTAALWFAAFQVLCMASGGLTGLFAWMACMFFPNDTPDVRREPVAWMTCMVLTSLCWLFWTLSMDYWVSWLWRYVRTRMSDDPRDYRRRYRKQLIWWNSPYGKYCYSGTLSEGEDYNAKFFPTRMHDTPAEAKAQIDARLDNPSSVADPLEMFGAALESKGMSSGSFAVMADDKFCAIRSFSFGKPRSYAAPLEVAHHPGRAYALWEWSEEKREYVETCLFIEYADGAFVCGTRK